MQEIKILSRLDTQVQDANHYYEQAARNVKLFVDTVHSIYEGKEWKSEFSNWDDYCEKYLPVNSSRIRQLDKHVIFTELIESVSVLTPVKKEVNALCKIVAKSDQHMIPVIYSYAHKLADGTPANRHFKAAYEVQKELEITGFVSVDGETILPTNLALLAAHQEAVMETDKRFKQHKLGNKQSIAATAVKLTNGDYTITSDDELPSEFEFKLWIAKENEE